MREMLEAIRFIGIAFVVILAVAGFAVAFVAWHLFAKKWIKRKVLDKNGNP